MAPLPCSVCVRLQTIAHKPAEHRMGPDAGICSPVLVEIASAALSDRWVPWEVGDGSLRWTAGATIGRPVGGGAGVALAMAGRRGPLSEHARIHRRGCGRAVGNRLAGGDRGWHPPGCPPPRVRGRDGGGEPGEPGPPVAAASPWLSRPPPSRPPP